jgi:hypothetical protein
MSLPHASACGGGFGQRFRIAVRPSAAPASNWNRRTAPPLDLFERRAQVLPIALFVLTSVSSHLTHHV